MSHMFLASDPDVRVRFPALANFLRSSGLERGQIGLVSATAELLEKKSSGSGIENRYYGRRGIR
jgi:hypothetical protein